ncbi:unnamed protein product [Spirodela intermedia]|uniref:PWWP domain-containing protein n=1 Tax=Spirodela intermedia TaxID=51605 RepID=A0A7I8JUJ2_SPIIN|nr:unnamed protein product [Spirodela intermedia]CAA6673764.1 unnamed protein product [Spirodela intermedia]
MGSSEGGAGDGGVGTECTVGTIVWVRRRNGSWWPGRILGQHELSASHLMSPRSGTPVKLLGREDASVDWYNLEKSKRVKAFRCGEFDACIERAEASLGVPYGRGRNMHKRQLELQQPNNLSHKHSGVLKKELSSPPSFGLHKVSDECASHGKSVNVKPKLHSRISAEEVGGSSPLHALRNKNSTQLNWEDENSGTMPRMRGLQDFGLPIAPSKRKTSSSVACERTKHSFSDDHVDIHPDSMHGMGTANSAGNGKSSLAVKRKRSQGGLTEESLIKRRDRRRPLVQVLKSSAKLPVPQSSDSNCELASAAAKQKEHIGDICHDKRSRPIYMPDDSSDCLNPTGNSSDQMRISLAQYAYGNGLHLPGSSSLEGTSSGLIGEDDTGSSERDCGDVNMEEEDFLLQGLAIVAARWETVHWLIALLYDKLLIPEAGSFLEDEHILGKIGDGYEPSISDGRPHSLSNDEGDGAAADVAGVSKWHMKGKRNIRSLLKRGAEAACNGPPDRTAYEKKAASFSKKSREGVPGLGLYHRGDEEELDCADEDELSEKAFGGQLPGFSQRSYQFGPKALGASITHDSDVDSQEMFPPGWSSFWGELDECPELPLDHHHHQHHHPPGVEWKIPLVDVDLKVQATYQGSESPGFSDEPPEREGDYRAPGADRDIGGRFYRSDDSQWQRGAGASSWCRGEPVGSGARLGLFKEPPAAAATSTQGSSMKKAASHRRPAAGKSSSRKKLQKKAISLSSQKTRTLSSIVTERRRSGKSAGSRQGRKEAGILGGLIKPGGTVPLVTCVPMKVVFSRIMEAVGRPRPLV